MPTNFGRPFQSYYEYDRNGNLTRLARNGHETAALRMDDLSYTYDRNGTTGRLQTNNQLLEVIDDAQPPTPPSPYVYAEAGDYHDAGGPGNQFEYDELGHKTKDAGEGIVEIEWTPARKVKRVEYADGSEVRYRYGALGGRIAKITVPASAQSPADWEYMFYGPGATYELKMAAGATRQSPFTVLCNSGGGQISAPVLETDYSAAYALRDHGISGGLWQLDELLTDPAWAPASYPGGGGAPVFTRGETIGCFPEYEYFTMQAAFAGFTLERPDPETTYVFVRGHKRYQISNHLGSVAAVVSDKVLYVESGGAFSHFEADIHALTDYYPFGMPMPGRSAKLYDDSGTPRLILDIEAAGLSVFSRAYPLGENARRQLAAYAEKA